MARRGTKSKVNNQPQYLITGASGQLGRELLNQFDEEEQLFKTHEALDITNLVEVQRQLPMLRPDVVIHTAAFTCWSQCEKARSRAWQVNAMAVDNLIKTCALEGIPLMHISDGSVFGHPVQKTGGHRETDPICPINWYSQTKAAGEQAVLGLSQCMNPEYWDHGFRYWLIRTSEMFERPWRQSQNLPYRVVQRSRAKAGKSSSYPVATDVHRSFTYVPHLAKAIVWLARNYKEVVSGVYHIANQGDCSVYEFMREVTLCDGVGADIRPATAEEMAVAEDFNHTLWPRAATLNCDKWHEIANFEMPHWRDAAKEFGKLLASK